MQFFNECSMTNPCLITTDLSWCTKDLPFTSLCVGNQSSIVSTATMLWSGLSGVQILVEARDFSLLQNTQRGNSLPGVKQGGCEVNHSPPSRAKVKNEWNCTSTPTYAIMVWTEETLPSSSLRVCGQDLSVTHLGHITARCGKLQVR